MSGRRRPSDPAEIGLPAESLSGAELVMVMTRMGMTEAETAAALRVPVRTLSSWVAAERPIPPAVVDDLLALLARFRDRAEEIAVSLRMHAGPGQVPVLGVPRSGEWQGLTARQWMALAAACYQSMDDLALTWLDLLDPEDRLLGGPVEGWN